MHNKFIVVDGQKVITGSPNFTYAAYNYNIESCVVIENPYIARLYQEYYEYIIDQTEEKKTRVRELMNKWNNVENIPVQVCLAPLINIAEFIINRISAVQIININMFLISKANNPDNDIVTYLSNASKEKAKVTVKVDAKQYNQCEFMKDAIQALMDNDVTVSTVEKNSQRVNTRTKNHVRTIPQFHDKLILVEYKDGTKKVIIGSAGFTTNVQDNLNYENMVSINDATTYNFLLNHFNSIENSRSGLKIIQLQ